MPKILLVEDDQALAASVREFLSQAQYTSDWASNGNDALEYLLALQYDLAILDWQLPGLPGVEVCQQYRKTGGKTAILMLTGMSTIDQKEKGLDAGADDYLTKPFQMRELMARVRALLRRPTQFAGELLRAGEICLDTKARIATKHGIDIKLQPNELAVLEYLMRHPNEVVSPEMLLARVWSSETEASLDAVYTCLNRIRKKIDASDKDALIRTVRGVGYRLVAPES
ncbi:MAG: response regulator transcription factor [Candidatus Obscuribacterales bacterium]|nr:response regulator transcription factor [Candidatus Obscuribacterales bacterium]